MSKINFNLLKKFYRSQGAENMKDKRILIASVLFLLTSIGIIITGCEYDVAEPQWDTGEFKEPQRKPKINSIDPSAVVPGVNTITINGENLDIVPDSSILLDVVGVTVVPPEIIEKTSTAITIRRPNLVTDSCIVKLIPDSGLVVKSSPIKIDQVIEPFGSFLDNFPIGGVVVDNSENIYVARADTSRTIFKVTPDGQKTTLGRATRLPAGITYGPEGQIYIFSANQRIERLNLETGQFTEWHRLKTNRNLSMGSFDSNGYLYTCGNRIDLWVVAPDSTSIETGLYKPAGGDTIYSLKVHREGAAEYLYLAVGSSSGRAIWRHTINADGSLSPRDQPFINLEGFATPRDIAFASDGKIFIGTDGPFSMLVNTNVVDYFYKDIVPPFGKFMRWGHGNYLYLISGNSSSDAALAQNWSVYKVDMGITGE